MLLYKVLLIFATLSAYYCAKQLDNIYLIFMTVVLVSEVALLPYAKNTGSNIAAVNTYAAICLLFYTYVFVGLTQFKAFLSLCIVLYFGCMVLTSPNQLLTAEYASALFIILVFFLIGLGKETLDQGKFSVTPKNFLGLGLTLFLLFAFPALVNLQLLTSKSNGIVFANLMATANILLALGYLGAALCPILTQRSTES